jgi:hypothetical protein
MHLTSKKIMDLFKIRVLQFQAILVGLQVPATFNRVYFKIVHLQHQPKLQFKYKEQVHHSYLLLLQRHHQ